MVVKKEIVLFENGILDKGMTNLIGVEKHQLGTALCGGDAVVKRSD